MAQYNVLANIHKARDDAVLVYLFIFILYTRVFVRNQRDSDYYEYSLT